MRTMTEEEAAQTICPVLPPTDDGVRSTPAKCCGKYCQMWEIVDLKPQFGYCGMRSQNRTIK